MACGYCFQQGIPDKSALVTNETVDAFFAYIRKKFAALGKQKMPINLRSVVDLENITDLVNLAEFLEEKGWLSLPPQLFKTQIGRNYELIDCYAKPQHLMTQIELWGQYASLCKQHPVLTKFHRPDFKGIRKLVDTGEMYMASFDTCPACKTEWVFDLHGKIYGCTASCGREEYPLGTYWPEVNLNQASIQTWQNRDVTTIPKCKDCKYDVICGGGCGVVAANKNKGEILAPDCRPIQELIEIGVNYYFEDIKGMTAQVEQKNQRMAHPAVTTLLALLSDCCETKARHALIQLRSGTRPVKTCPNKDSRRRRFFI